MPEETDSPKLIKGVSEKPLGLRIQEHTSGDKGINIFDISDGLIHNVYAALHLKSGFTPGPAPFPVGMNLRFGHRFDLSDVERVYKDDELIWIPREMRPKKEKIALLDQGTITLELLDYPEIAKFIQENREAFARLGLIFDK